MANGRLQPPNLDDRSWQDLVDEAKAMIDTYAPEWTDRGPSDLGITLIELFAWLVEQMIYRLNRVPERNFIEFLNLIGITIDPASPASTMLVFQVFGSVPAVVEVPAGTVVSTVETETQRAVMFETDERAEVVPARLAQVLVSTSSAAPFAVEDATGQLAAAPLKGRTLEVTLGGGPLSLFLGFDAEKPPPAAVASRLKLAVRVNPLTENRSGPVQAPPPATFTWTFARMSSAAVPALEFVPVESATPGATVQDDTNGFLTSGALFIPNPAERWGSKLTGGEIQLTTTSPALDLNVKRYWLCLTVTPGAGPPPAGAASRRSMPLGHLLFNSAPATNALTFPAAPTAPPDLVSNGRPFQSFDLAKRPLYKQPGGAPYDHLRLEVKPPGGTAEVWPVLEELPETDRKAARLDPVTGTIEFGDGRRGAIPPANSEVRAVTYRYVAGGLAGNLPPGSLTLLRKPLPGILAVTNPGPASGGTDEEDVQQTLKRGPEALRLRGPGTTRNRFRTVTIADFEYQARESTRVAKARCLGPDPATADKFFGQLDRGPGHVTVIIVPNEPDQPQPTPDTQLIGEVQSELNRLKVVATSVTVTFPRYVPVRVTLSYKLFSNAAAPVSESFQNDLEARLAARIEAYLHPLTGNMPSADAVRGPGWEIGQSLFVADLYNALKDVVGRAGFLSSLTVQSTVPEAQRAPPPNLGRFALDSQVGVSVADYELICGAGTHTIKPA
jgi:predicted phage baseplate assembly protein